MHHVQHTESTTGADVQHQGIGCLSLEQVVESLAMGFRQIHHVQVIADAGAIWGGVVLPKMRNFHGGLRPLE